LEWINHFGWTLLAFIFVLGIMIFVHELGHHLMAKYLKIRVDVFSLGFGPRIFGFRYGDTDYRVSAIPLGGYVRMRGENFDESLSGGEDEFLSRPKTHRFAVAIAGPAMNLALAVILLAGNYMAGVQVPAYLSEPAVISNVLEDSPAAEAGLTEGDRILSVAGSVTPTWEGLQIQVATLAGRNVEVVFERDGQTFQRIVGIAEDPATGIGYIGVLPPSQTLIDAVEEGPALEAGLRPGDVILAVEADGYRSKVREDIVRVLGSSLGRPVEFTVRRGEETFVRSITPVEMEGKARVGIVLGSIVETRIERYDPLSAVARSVERNYQMAALTFRIVGKLITGQSSIKMMSGPIEIARFSGQAASQGASALTGFMALISLQLGIFNLLPIPILDGGVIALLLIEGLMGRDLSMRVKERIFQVGFIFLVLLMGIVIFNDISKNI
jgi:regulator of sigma E protease